MGKQVDLEMVGKGRARLMSHSSARTKDGGRGNFIWAAGYGRTRTRGGRNRCSKRCATVCARSVLSHKYQNKWGECVQSEYTIDGRDATSVTQQNLFSGKRRLLRAVYLMAHEYTLPPPTEPPADPAGPAPADL